MAASEVNEVEGWEIRLLDTYALVRDDEVVKLMGITRPDALLAYLAMHSGRMVRRADAAGFLWPDKPESTGRKLLTEVLFRLNRDLRADGAPENMIAGNKQLIGLDPHVRTDVDELQELARAHAGAAPRAQQKILERMEALHGHGLLPLMHGDWVEGERARIEGLLREVRDRTIMAVSTSRAGSTGTVPGLTEADVESELQFEMPLEDQPASLRSLRRAHAQRIATLVGDAEEALRGPNRQAWVQRLDGIVDEVHDALAWLIRHEDWELAFRIVAPMWRYWIDGAAANRGRAYLDEVVTRGHTRSKVHRAKALQGSGALAALAGDLPQAQKRLEQALAIWSELGDRGGVGGCLLDMGIVSYRQERYAEAKEQYEEGLRTQREVGDVRGELSGLKNLALVALRQERLEEAQSLLDRRLELCRDQGDELGEAETKMSLSTIAQLQEDWDRSETFIEQALHTFRTLHAPRQTAFALRALAYTYQHTDRVDLARSTLQQSLEISTDLQNLHGIGDAFRLLGELEAEHGEATVAREHLERARRLLQADGEQGDVTNLLPALERWSP